MIVEIIPHKDEVYIKISSIELYPLKEELEVMLRKKKLYNMFFSNESQSLHECFIGSWVAPNQVEYILQEIKNIKEDMNRTLSYELV